MSEYSEVAKEFTKMAVPVVSKYLINELEKRSKVRVGSYEIYPTLSLSCYLKEIIAYQNIDDIINRIIFNKYKRKKDDKGSFYITYNNKKIYYTLDFNIIENNVEVVDILCQSEMVDFGDSNFETFVDGLTLNLYSEKGNLDNLIVHLHFLNNFIETIQKRNEFNIKKSYVTLKIKSRNEDFMINLYKVFKRELDSNENPILIDTDIEDNTIIKVKKIRDLTLYKVIEIVKRESSFRRRILKRVITCP